MKICNFLFFSFSLFVRIFQTTFLFCWLLAPLCNVF